ncbi:LPS export ABC transporter permease LptF [Mesobaculum littorinae]|uniref:LPS export ABC transporter permease LptF n=1 Tax=Mesobaculum littorinae TaxID=2486419 RepID=A0A438AJX2_9RHOB|nr:LPS export ABC transporter permease LptF [Mesobaculum littorinae]RVV98936.1 LPS export ABC transporter permease LptF [Mesobaculum littorinae]
MTRIDRYLLSQFLWLFGFFSLVLVLVYWINRAVGLFDMLIANGQSAGVFLEFSLLALPNVIRLVLPVSAFAAAVYVTNRLAAESELVAMQAQGASPARLARPVATFGLIAMLLVLALTNLLVPASLSQLAVRTSEVAQNLTARLLKDGEFLHPAEGLTFYIREITPEGEMRDIFLSDRRDPQNRVDYTAASALLLRSDGAPTLVMRDGLIQSLAPEGQRLATTAFQSFTYDMTGLMQAGGDRDVEPEDLSTWELLSRTEAVARRTDTPVPEVLSEVHSRFTQAIKALSAPLLGFAILMSAGFSRFGMWRQILAAIGAVVAMEALDAAAADMAERGPDLWGLRYIPALVALALACGLLWRAGRPGRAPKQPPASGQDDGPNGGRDDGADDGPDDPSNARAGHVPGTGVTGAAEPARDGASHRGPARADAAAARPRDQAAGGPA